MKNGGYSEILLLNHQNPPSGHPHYFIPQDMVTLLVLAGFWGPVRDGLTPAARLPGAGVPQDTDLPDRLRRVVYLQHGASAELSVSPEFRETRESEDGGLQAQLTPGPPHRAHLCRASVWNGFSTWLEMATGCPASLRDKKQPCTSVLAEVEGGSAWPGLGHTPGETNSRGGWGLEAGAGQGSRSWTRGCCCSKGDRLCQTSGLGREACGERARLRVSGTREALCDLVSRPQSDLE